MSRTLTANAQAERAKADGAFPLDLIKIEWGGTVGTKWYADQKRGDGDASTFNNAQARVESWGDIQVKTALKPKPFTGDISLRLIDDDQVLAGFLDDEDIENKPVTVYQFWDGLVEADLLIIFKGIATGPVEWSEGPPRIMMFDITDTGSTHDRVFATIADRDTFANVSEADEGKVVPLVYGEVQRSRCLFAQAGGRTRLVNSIDEDDASIIVEDIDQFTAGSPITIRIGQEHIEGSFDGREFTATQRGAAIAAGGTINGTHANPRVFATDFTGTDGQYVGYFLKVTVPRHISALGGIQFRRILRSAADGTIEVAFPFTYEGTINDWDGIAHDILMQIGMTTWIPTNTSADIVTQAVAHDPGEEVVEVLAKYVYIVNDAPSVAVNGVYGYGKKVRIDPRVDYAFSGRNPLGFPTQAIDRYMTTLASQNIDPNNLPDGMVIAAPTKDEWVSIDPTTYVINRNDSATFPGLGHAVTTITFHGLPPALTAGYGFNSEELFVDVEGVDSDRDGTGTLVDNPSDVIKDLLENAGTVTAGETNDASFADAGNRMEGFKFGFALAERRKLMDVAQDLAFQCRSTLLWEDGEVYLRWLENGTGASVLTVDDDARLMDSLRLGRTDFETEVYSEVVARWTDKTKSDGSPQDREVAVSDATAEANYGRKVLNINLWALKNKSDASTIATFWLRRFKQVWTILRFSTYLNTVELQREDSITIDLTDYFAAGAKANILGITHRPGAGRDGRLDQIDYEAWSPWCDTSCQAFCETAGCETTMQVVACTDTCETAGQAYCNLSCVTAAQLICTTEVAPCEPWVETGDLFCCSDTCEPAVETNPCMIESCTIYCEPDNCDSACQGGACQSTCVCTSCTTVCETVYETIPVPCGDTCELTCQCECQSICEAWCETCSETLAP